MPVQQREPAEQTALRRIHALLSTGVFDWFITDAEAREVLHILQRLAPEPLLRAVQMMRLSGDWRPFRRELPDSDWPALGDLELTIDRNVGYVMYGDDIRLEVWAGSKVQREVSLEYNVAPGRSRPDAPSPAGTDRRPPPARRRGQDRRRVRRRADLRRPIRPAARDKARLSLRAVPRAYLAVGLGRGTVADRRDLARAATA